jgi:hypothetical protein
MSKWAEPIKEFHQLVTPDGEVYDLTAPSREGRWVMNSQGWGMPGVEWLTQQAPFQHGATVMDYRLQPRTLQLMVRQNYCNRDDYWAGRQALIDAVRPNRTPISFKDYWTPRSQYQGGGSYPAGDDQKSIMALAEFNGLLYGGTGEDGSGTGGILLVWDGAGAWVQAEGQVVVDDHALGVLYAEQIECLCPVVMDTPIFETVRSGQSYECWHTAGYDAYATMDSPLERFCQAFTPDEDCYLSDVQIMLYQSSLTGKVWVEIYLADASGLPTGGILTSASMDAAYLDTSDPGDWAMFGDQGGPDSQWSVANLALTSGTTYVMAVWADSAATGESLTWHFQSGAGPAGEEAGYSTNGGTTWAASASHAMFVVWKQDFAWEKTGEYEDRPLLLAGTSHNRGMVVPWDGAWLDYMGYFGGGKDAINDIIQYSVDGKVYCVGEDLYLYEYTIDMTTAQGDFTATAHCHTATDGRCLAEYDDGGGSDIYCGADNGRLYKWDGTVGGNMDQVCAAPGVETVIWDLVVHNGELFGCTGPNGYLVRYDVAGGHWDVVSQSLGNDIRTLKSWKGRLYGMGDDGHLYRWNDVDTWTVILHEYTGEGAAEQILSSIVYNSRFFAGTQTGAYLLEWVHERTYSVPQCTVLRRLLSTGAKRDLCVYIAEGPQFDPNEPGWDEFNFTEMLRFIAYNPVMYDPDVVSVPYLFGTGSISDYEDITYTGTWETHPTLILTGPLTNPMILNEGLDLFIQLAYEIPDGDVVTIDLEDGTITDQDNQNLVGAVTAESALSTFRLAPTPELTGGVNRVRLVASDAGANSDFEVQYYRRYIGI